MGDVESSVLAGWTGTLLRALAEHDVDIEALVGDIGIDPSVLADPERRIPLAASTQLWQAAERITGDDAFGIEVSRFVTAGTFHGLGHAFMTSSTLRASLERAARFSRVTADATMVTTEVRGDEFVYVSGWRDDTTRPADMAVVAALAAIVRAARTMLGRHFAPRALELRQSPPRHLERFQQFFRCELRFDSDEYRLRLAATDVDRPWPGAHERLAAIADSTVEAYLADLPEIGDGGSIARAVADVVADTISVGDPDIGAVAAELAMSTRTLQRRLGDEGTTFRNVIADTRRDLAERLLRNTELSVTVIGHRLGFSETAAFSRAFRRWTGSSPATWRRNAES